MIGVEDSKKEVSNFQPSPEVRELTRKIKQDYQSGHQNLHTSFAEFNDMSVIDRMNLDQKRFNSYIEPRSANPDEAWRYKGVRPITRNKIISIAAHVTATILVPNIFAQNDQDEEDRMAANVMRDLVEWTIKHSDYELSFLYAVIGALVNPATFMKAEFAQVTQTIREKNERGEVVKREIIDEVLSGFQAHVIPVDEMLIPNVYEFDLQKQKSLIRRRFIEFDEAQGQYGDHENWQFIRVGVKSFYSEQDGMFYDQFDEDLTTLVEEVTYYNRREDTQVVYVNGIYLGKDNVEDNRMKHRDNRNAPKYPFSKTGYEPVDEKKFFYYKSAVSKLQNEQDLIDKMYQMVMDGTFLSVMPPVVNVGEDHVDTSVVFPGAVTNLPQGNAITPVNVGTNLNAGYSALSEIERSMSQSSQDDQRAGVANPSVGTAFEAAQLERNARIQLGLFGKMLGKFVTDFGNLMVDDILHHLTTAQIEEVIAGRPRLKFRTFLLNDQTVDGKKVTKAIRFSDELMGRKLTKEQRRQKEFALFEEEGGEDATKRIYVVNPFLFSRLKFMTFIEPDSLLPKNTAFEKAMNLEAYDRMIQNPMVDQESVTRDFLVETFAKGESDKYMKKAEQVIGQPIPQGPQGGTSALVEQATGSNSLVSLLQQ